jgi:lipid-A-disaccharide synthase-like uncharacterized protein
MIQYFQQLSNTEILFLSIGLVGQSLFASRFLYQWVYSERLGKSSIPIMFWYLSIFGGFFLLIYAIFRKDPIIILGQTTGIFIYLRNLFLIYRRNDEKN